MDTTTQQVSRQQYTPYGQQRTSPNTTTWPDATHTYLGKPQDTTTGYTDIGARKYDPTTGHFISIDPLLNVGDPQSLGGYAYADDNPATLSDPSGQCPVDLCGGGEGKGGSTTGEVTHVDQASSVYQDVPWVPMDRDGNVACSDRCQVFPGISVPATKAWKADITKFVHKFYNRYYYNAGMNDPYFMTDWQTNNSAAAELQLWLWSACGDTQCPDRGSMLTKALGAGVAAGWAASERGGPGEIGPGWFPYGSGKIPAGWSGPGMSKKFRRDSNKQSFIWRAPKGQDSVRIDRGDPNSYPSQQVDHVVVNSGGRIVGRGGELLPAGAKIQDYPEEAHIPLSEWQEWRNWNAP
jgi:RHS repeat-associated protein